MSFFKKLKDAFKGILGLDTGKDMAKAQQAELDRIKQQQELDAAQEVDNVVKFDDLETDGFTGTDRKRRKKTNSFGGNSLGLNV